MAQAGSQKGRIVTFRNDRLGGRITALVNSIRLSGALGAELVVRWNHTDDHGSVFNDPLDFFAPEFVDRNFTDRETYLALRGGLRRLDGEPDPVEIRSLLSQGIDHLVDRSIGLIVMQGESPSAVAAEAGSIWREHLPFAVALRAPMAAIREKIGSAAVAYHIRRGDVVSVPRAMNRPWPDKFIIDEVFETHIARSCAQGLRPILFSDDPSAVDRLVARFPGTLRGSDLVPASSLGEGQRDLLELFAMSLCRRIVAPGNSAFSSTAAVLGGRELVDITTDLTPEELASAHATMIRRLEEDMPAAIADSPGKVGQSLVHVAKRAQRTGATQDELQRAADLTLAGITGGAGISHLWSQAATLLLLLGDHEALRQLETASTAHTLYFSADLARLRAAAALAAALQDESASAARLALSAFAEATTLAPVTEAASLFYANGHLHAGNAPVFSAAARKVSRLIGLHFVSQPAFATLAHGLDRDVQGRVTMPNAVPVAWDWAPIIRHIPPGSLARSPLRPRFQQGIDALLKDRINVHDADVLSLVAIWNMHTAQENDWLDRLEDLARAEPDDSMVLLRLSHAAMVARRPLRSRDAAERAAEAAPGSAGHLAWRGFVRLRGRNVAGAREDLEAAAAQGLALPQVLFSAAKAAGEVGDDIAEGQHLDAALILAPRNGTLLLARAQYRQRAGDIAGAEADRNSARNLPFPPPQALMALGQ